MNEEKTLTRIDSEYEKALFERNKLQAELDRLTKKEMQDKHKIDTLKNHYKEQKRRSRNHRLIERGAILESFIPNAESYTNEQITLGDRFVQCSDVNGDGVTNIGDAMLILRLANGMISSFPVE